VACGERSGRQLYLGPGSVRRACAARAGATTRNSRVEEDLIDQLFNSSEKRLAHLLLLLAHFGREGTPQPILVDISQETLAEMIGTTRSRVSFFMNKFRKLGLISYNGKIEVHNSLLNAVLHEKPEIERDDPSSKV
jgi:CRP/FNR family transcriptional regulator, cyclic AMP receptor protein